MPDLSPEQSELLQYATEYCKRGWYIHPLYPLVDGKCSCANQDCKGKHPLWKDWVRRASNKLSDHISWITRKTFQGHVPRIGILCGTSSGIVVVDTDPRNGGLEKLKELQEKYGPLPQTYEVETGGGGSHHYFSLPVGREIHTCKLDRGIDIIGDGGAYVVAPPSPHNSGLLYKVVRNSQLETIPYWLLEVIDEESTLKDGKRAEPETIENGNRHKVLGTWAGIWYRNGMDEDTIFEYASKWNREKCETPLPVPELRQYIEYIVKQDRQNYTFDDEGNCKRFCDIDSLGGCIRYCKETGTWYGWNGKQWVEYVSKSAGDSFITAKVRTLLRDMHRIKCDQKYKTDLEIWAKRCRNKNRIDSMVSLLHSNEELWINQDLMDANPAMFNCTNGLVDLRSGKIIIHDRSMYISKCSGTDYVTGCRHYEWDKFVDEVCNSDDSLKKYMQLVCGYSITGRTDEEKMFFIIGEGGRGKTTFLEAVRGVVGDYSVVIKPEVLTASGKTEASNASPDVARLRNVRLAISSEMQKNVKLNEHTVKALTGGDKINARHLYKEAFEFVPKCKILISTNFFPNVYADDSGMKRRLEFVPFLFVPKIVRSDLKTLFREDKQVKRAILSWIIEGAKRWFSGEKCVRPKCVEEKNSEFWGQQNQLKLWFEEEYSTDNVENSEFYPNTGELFASFTMWLKENKKSLIDIGIKNKNEFSAKLQETFPNLQKTSQSKWRCRKNGF